MREHKNKQVKIGIFDSGLGGLTVVRSIISKLHGAEIIYMADTAYAPYGDKSTEQIVQRSLAITSYLINNHKIDALVIACNSATSAAISIIRQKYPKLPIVGTEPGIKPALKASKSGNVGVMATSTTLKGEKYQQLADRLTQKEKQVKLFEQACPGLVEQIESGKLNDKKTYDMLKHWLHPMKKAGVDTIVLGCTHYPIASKQIREIMGNEVVLIETGNAIAERLKNLLGDTKKSKDSSLSLYASSKIDGKIADMVLERGTSFTKVEIKS